MSLVITSPLQKSFPAITASSTQQDWEKAISDFVLQKKAETTALIALIDHNIVILEHQKERSNQLIAILEEAGGLTVRARNLMSTPADQEKYAPKIKEFEDWFKLTQKKLDQAVKDSAYENVNLMNGGKLETAFDAKGHHKLVTEGMALTCESLGIRTPDFSTTMTLQNARIDVMNAIDIVVTIRNTIAAHLSTLMISREFAVTSTEMADTSLKILKGSTLENEMLDLRKLADQGNKIHDGEALADQAQQDILNSFAESNPMENM